MERRHFLKLTIGFVAGAAALAASADAAPLPPISAAQAPLGAESAVISQAEVDHLKPEEVRWGHHWHRHWHRRHWGWRHRHRGWHHRRWHRHRW